VETASLEGLAAIILRRLEIGVRATASVLIADDKIVALHGTESQQVQAWRERWTPAAGDMLDCDRDDPLFPMRVPLAAEGVGNVGWILLGPRPDGSFYGKDEREALVAIAEPVASAVHSVRAREADTKRHEARFAALERKVGRLVRELAPRTKREASM
jgi:hypothetical protein